MEDIRVTLYLRVYKEQIENLKKAFEFKDERLCYSYVELNNDNNEKIDEKIEKMYVIAMIKFLNDYIKKHPVKNDIRAQISSTLNEVMPESIVVLTKEEYESLRQSLTQTTNRECELADRARALLHECDVLKIDLEKARKKAAEDFATNFENHLSDINNDFTTDDFVPEALYLMREIDEAMDKTLKDFNVEAEE